MSRENNCYEHGGILAQVRWCQVPGCATVAARASHWVLAAVYSVEVQLPPLSQISRSLFSPNSSLPISRDAALLGNKNPSQTEHIVTSYITTYSTFPVSSHGEATQFGLT